MSFPSAPSPSASSVAHDRSFDADFPETDQPLESIEDASEATESTGYINTSEEHFPDGDKSSVDNFADEFVVPPPQHTTVGPLEQPSNLLEGLNLNHDEGDESDDGDHRGLSSRFVYKAKSRYGVADPYSADVQPSFSSFVRKRNSAYSVAGPYSADVQPSFSSFVHKRNSVYSVDDPNSSDVTPSLSAGFAHRRKSVRNPSSNEDVSGEKHFDRSTPTSIWGFSREYKVKQLSLLRTLVLRETESIYEACRRMAARGTNIVLLTTASNEFLSGILTGKDIVGRVVSKGIDVVNTPISMVMTKNPTYVLHDTLAIKALQKMIEGKFRRLPVVENAEVIGLLDLAKCLSELVVLERSLSNSTENMERAEVVEGVED